MSPAWKRAQRYGTNNSLITICGLVWCAMSCGDARAYESKADDRFFEVRIRPLFLAHCLPCHSDTHADGGLSLESHDGWADREVIVLGDPDKSLLMKAVRGELEDLQMPPADAEQSRLSSAQIKDLEQWIREGAVDPRSRETAASGPARRARQFQITDQDLQHWAYQPLRSPAAAETSDSIATASVDQLVNAKLAAQGLHPSPVATPRELVRRAYFDLWGLPPEPEVVEQFAADPSDEAWSALIDRLLASRHYGERWGRYWLDWVRFAESNGYERDGPKPHAWRYRDYVIDSFQNDKPYDRFLVEQLAGDLLLADQALTPEKHAIAWREAIIATGYYRLHVWDDEPDNSQVAEFDDLDDVMLTTGAAVMGLTIGCARCHDHKFDPISQADYYSMLDLFRDIDPYGLTIVGGGGRGTGRIESWLCSSEELERWHHQQQQRIEDLEQQLESATEDRARELTSRIANLKAERPPFDQALSVQLRPGDRPVTHVLARGDLQTPLQKVHAAYPEIFHKLGWADETAGEITDEATRGPAGESKPGNQRETINNRLGFARWLTGRAGALTARVLANRIWLHHFGSGIVETPDDFGYTGLPPSNIELLDQLAHQLISNGWSIKSLHRTVMNSNTYRQSSAVVRPEAQANAARDPENRGFWRQNLRRLDAESIRDSQLAYAGVLHAKSGGPSVYSDLPTEIRETANPVSLSFWHSSPLEEQDCRSVYLFVKRSLKNPLLEAFDFANSHSPVGQRPITTVAPQALVLLNNEFVRQQAERIFSRIADQSNNPETRILLIWRLVWQRQPTDRELQSALEFLMVENDSRAEAQRWIALVRVVLNSNETIYID